MRWSRLERLMKTLVKIVAVECYANRHAKKALREIETAYREMLEEMVEYAVRHGASRYTLHKIFYRRFRERYPWLPTRVILGEIGDAVKRAKSFREFKKKSKAYTDKPEIRRITITYSSSHDWRIGGGVIRLKVRTGVQTEWVDSST